MTNVLGNGSPYLASLMDEILHQSFAVDELYAMKKTKETCLLICILLIFLTQCSGIPSYLDDSACPLPCWYTIEPGKTRDQDVISIIKNIPHIKKETIERRGDGTQFLFPDNYFWRFMDGSEGRISITHNMVFEIEFTQIKLPLEKFIERYGTPDEVIITPYYIKKRNIFLLYSNKGGVLLYRKQESSDQRVVIHNSDIIEEINFFSVENFQETLSLFFSQYTYPRSHASIIQMWRGFGEYQVIPPAP